MAAGQERPVIWFAALKEVEEFQEVVRLQKEIWGFADLDVLPVRLFIVARKIGGQVFGAFNGSRMIGFCVSIPGIRPGYGQFLHSNMLGVLEHYRNAGVGRMLKLAQRDDALGRGIGLIEWTFDPLDIKNAYFNMERLGAVVKRYVLNQYGITTSELHGGLPTDRCVAEWYLDSARVRAALTGQPVPRPAIEARIAVPTDIAGMKRSNPAKAREVQERVSHQFLEGFRAGLTVVSIEQSQSEGTYLLGKWEP